MDPWVKPHHLFVLAHQSMALTAPFIRFGTSIHGSDRNALRLDLWIHGSDRNALRLDLWIHGSDRIIDSFWQINPWL